mgnify:FL=1
MAPETRQNWPALLYALALHAGFLVLIVLASYWVLPFDEQASEGEPVQATLSFSADDLSRAKAAIKAAEQQQASAENQQPKPEPRPQTSDIPLQETAQDWIDNPDLTDQQEIDRNAELPSEALVEQERKQKQGQVELTDDIKKDVAEENRQRLLKQQLEAVRKQRAELQADIEAQKLDELAAGGRRTPSDNPVAIKSGQGGSDTGLGAKYKAALNAAARANWNTAQIPEQTRCQVEFTQIRGGEVIDVAFLSCPLDVPGRESIERALLRSPMPYAGFETVFQRKVTLTFCYPDEVCQ